MGKKKGQVNTVTTPEQQPTTTPAMDNPTQEGKAQKIQLTWKEKMVLVPQKGLTNNGEQLEGEFKERVNFLVNNRLTKIGGMEFTSLLLPGYMDRDTKISSFSKYFGLQYKEYHQKALKDNSGKVFTISLGSSFHHIQIIQPSKDIKVLDREGKEITLTPANYLQYSNSFTNHGRTYKSSRLLAGKYNLIWDNLEEGNYTQSNSTNWNLQQEEKGDRGKIWTIYTTKGVQKELPDKYQKDISQLVMDILEGKAGELIK